jgi:hypothetical protein
MFRRNFLKLEIVGMSDSLPRIPYEFRVSSSEAARVQTTAGFFLSRISVGNKIENVGLNSLATTCGHSPVWRGGYRTPC